jgi:hypothetical protein
MLILGILLPDAATAGVDDLAVTDRHLVSRQRVGRTHFDYTYTVLVDNAGLPLENGVANVSSLSTNTQIVDGEVTLGHLASGTTQPSDTFTLRQNRREPFNPDDLIWSFSADEPVVGDSPPSISSSPETSGTLGSAYAYDVQASDPDAGDVLTYSLLTAPPGMSIDAATRLISWMPGSTGPADVDLQVTDSTGLSHRQADPEEHPEPGRGGIAQRVLRSSRHTGYRDRRVAVLPQLRARQLNHRSLLPCSASRWQPRADDRAHLES